MPQTQGIGALLCGVLFCVRIVEQSETNGGSVEPAYCVQGNVSRRPVEARAFTDGSLVSGSFLWCDPFCLWLHSGKHARTEILR